MSPGASGGAAAGGGLGGASSARKSRAELEAEVAELERLAALGGRALAAASGR